MLSKVVHVTFFMSFWWHDFFLTIKDLGLDNILLEEKIYEEILRYNAACKTPYGLKSSRIIFNNVDGFVRK